MKRVLTGDRTTGLLHLGHYVGSLKNRFAMQNDYEMFILLADVQALTTHFDNPKLINDAIYDVAIDNLSVGLDPLRVNFVQQSAVPYIAELTIFYSMLVTVNQLSHNPTIKTEAANYGYSELTYGFLGYPVSQTADITFLNADLVPVGEDQKPHIELSRKIVRKFNELYKTSIKEPEAMISKVGRLCGLDGKAKMGKSLGNALYLSDTKEIVDKKIMSAFTDPQRLSVKIPGRPEICAVASYHRAFNEGDCENIFSMCKISSLGCVACKRKLAQIINDLLEPMREKRSYYVKHKREVKDIIIEGTKMANDIGFKNLQLIKEKMNIKI